MLTVANDSVSGENCCPNSDSSEGKQEPATVSGTKKKPTMLKSVELSNFVIDNDIRAAAGFKKISFKQSRLLSPPTASVKKENLARKGIRRQKSPTPMKKKILEAQKYNEPTCSSINDTSFSPTLLDEKVIELLKRLKKQANAVQKANPTKARAKRTFICGLHESLKHVKADNVKCIILARNIDAEMTTVSLFHTLREECLTRGTPIIRASTKRSLSRALEKFPYTNVVALLHFQGFIELYCDIIDLWMSDHSHIDYHKDQTSLFA